MYGKIFSSLYQGTLRGKAHAILVFMNLIASCDKCGIADRHWRAIAEEIGLTVDEVKAAIDYLESPDDESRSKEHDGRRLIRVAPDRAWGWVIVNYGKYRDMRDEEDRRVYMREYMRTRRQVPEETPPVNNLLTSVNSVNSVNFGKLPLAKAEVDAEVHASLKENILTPPPSPGAQPRARDADAGADTPTPPGDGGGARQKVSGIRFEAVRSSVDAGDALALIRAYGGDVTGKRRDEWLRDANGRTVGRLATVFWLAMGDGSPIRQPSGLRAALTAFESLPLEERNAWCRDAAAAIGFKVKEDGT